MNLEDLEPDRGLAGEYADISIPHAHAEMIIRHLEEMEQRQSRTEHTALTFSIIAAVAATLSVILTAAGILLQYGWLQ